jgi:hypothetical protein
MKCEVVPLLFLGEAQLLRDGLDGGVRVLDRLAGHLLQLVHHLRDALPVEVGGDRVVGAGGDQLQGLVLVSSDQAITPSSSCLEPRWVRRSLLALMTIPLRQICTISRGAMVDAPQPVSELDTSDALRNFVNPIGRVEVLPPPHMGAAQ